MTEARSELATLYRETVLDHSRSPRNFGRLQGANRQAQGHNPLCGDKLTVYLRDRDERIDAVRFEGVGCAICTASASLMTEVVTGQRKDEARATAQTVMETLADANSDAGRLPGDMPALAGVRRYPSRVKCATLPWRTLALALEEGAAETATTE